MLTIIFFPWSGFVLHRNLKLPSRRPSIVCENCLYSLEKDRRIRAFHVMDSKGILDMLLIFLEDRGSTAPSPPTFDYSQVNSTHRWSLNSINCNFSSKLSTWYPFTSGFRMTKTGLNLFWVHGKGILSQSAVVFMERHLLKLIQWLYLKWIRMVS